MDQCCTLWALWMERNRRVHEHLERNSGEISKFILLYLAEIDGTRKRRATSKIVDDRWEPPVGEGVKINFHASYDKSRFRSGSGIVARDSRGKVVVSKVVLHKHVNSSFAADALACLEAIKMGQDLGFEEAIV